MSENNGKERSKLSLSGKGTLSLGSSKEPSGEKSIRQNIAPGRSKPVAVEVRKRKRNITIGKDANKSGKMLTNEEKESRIRALQLAQATPRTTSPIIGQTSLKIKEAPVIEKTVPVKEDAGQSTSAEKTTDTLKKATPEELRKRELEKLNNIEKKEEESETILEQKRQDELARLQKLETAQAEGTVRKQAPIKLATRTSEEDSKKRRAVTPSKPGTNRRRETGRISVSDAINNDFDRGRRTRSLASQRRAREKERMQARGQSIETIKHFHEVIIPEVITVQELSNRMKERAGDVVKKLMEMGVMATITQNIEIDIAELVVQEFGHTVKRVSDSDVEDGLHGEADKERDLKPRPPVVTIMGHVDHGKTSLLDAIRSTSVTAKEAGGITQHIGAYQIRTESGQKITFIDTPGHAAFTEMRSRGADSTDIVVIVVAADDSVMPQTIESISHAKAANKPIIIAINKCDLPAADANKVRTELLQYEVVVESMGGDVQEVEVSAITKSGLKELEEAIILQAELLELKANPKRPAIGTVIEAKLEQGRGNVATVLIQHGTLNIGDIFVTGAKYGRVRALLNDSGDNVKHAKPGQPIEVVGLNGSPDAGEDFVVVKDEARAREVAEYREDHKRALISARNNKGTLEQMMQQIKDGEAEALNVIIKADVHGSVEAISSSLTKLTEDNPEVKVSLLHTGVGGITESDVTLANASNAIIIGFNVRANSQARSLAKRDGVEVRYYSIIYNAIDDVKSLLNGMLSPELSEKFIGYAEIRQVFNITKVGKIAGCMITEGMVKRGAKVRLLRDNVVIHEGMLKTLQRFKDEVKEVREGFECGMAFETYDNIKEGDMIEAFEVVEKERTLDDIAKANEKSKNKK